MNLQRLEHLITVLERVQDAELPFDMEQWVKRSEYCGTSACAGGYAALDPDFQAQGLGLVIVPNGSQHEHLAHPQTIGEFNEAAQRLRDRMPMALVFLENGPDDGPFLAFEAMERFFDITVAAADYLFDPSAYIGRDAGPEDVIDRVRQVIACDGHIPPYNDDDPEYADPSVR